MTRRLSLLLAAALALVALPRVGAAANTAPALDAFNDAFAKLSQFTYKLHSHEVKGADTQDRVYDYSFMKPHFAKTLIESGPGRGGGAVWTGGDQVSGHQGGMLSFVHLKISIHDGRATSLRGYTIPDGLPQSIVATYANVAGTLAQSAGGKVGGVDTDLLDLKVADPASNGGISEQKIYLAQDTHFPVRQTLYSGDQVVLDQTFTDWNFDPKLTENDFPF
jgi:outer membrane lipoprotein-sorting protein